MEILNYINANKHEFNEDYMKNNAIHKSLEELKEYLKLHATFLSRPIYCIYECYDPEEEDGCYININYLTNHAEGHLTDDYETDAENNFFNSLPCIDEVTESTFGMQGLYKNKDREHMTVDSRGQITYIDVDYYELTKKEEIWYLKKVIKILCEYPAFQVLESPWHEEEHEYDDD